MSDTIQVVRWMLEQTCPLRRADEWSNPLLNKARIYGSHLKRGAKRDHQFAMREGICVTATQLVGPIFAEPSQRIPVEGFDFAQAFAPLSGDGLQQMCGACPAHAAKRAVAGCTGGFYLSPTSQELDEHLRILVAELGLEAALEREFLPTRLLWFGLWADSPLSRGALEVLESLLGEFARRHIEDKRKGESIGDFLGAVGAALENDLTLRVELLPPGHTDFGWHSIFAHCPRCKAGAPVHPWKKVRSQTLECGICDFSFDPAKTVAREAIDFDYLECDSLLEILGEARFRKFATGYMMARGVEENEARGVVEKHLAPPDPEIEAQRKLEEAKSRAKGEWMRTVLCGGLGTLKDGEDAQDALSSSFWFSAAEVEILLARCRKWSADAELIWHNSDDEEWDELSASAREFGSIEAAFADLRQQGCNERFSVMAGISDEAWHAYVPEE